MRAGIVGGGIGGLALAHGLRRLGSETVVRVTAAVREARPALRRQRRLANPLLRLLAVEIGFPLAAAALRCVRAAAPDPRR